MGRIYEVMFVQDQKRPIQPIQRLFRPVSTSKTLCGVRYRLFDKRNEYETYPDFLANSCRVFKNLSNSL